MMNCECNVAGSAICPSCGTHYQSSAHRYTDGGTANGEAKFKEYTNLPELEAFGFSDGMKTEMTKLFYAGAGNKTKRNAPRRAMIFLAIISVCKSRTIPFDKAQLMTALNITDRHINTAMKDVAMNVPVATASISVDDIVKEIIKTLDLKQEIFSSMMATYYACRRTSIMFNSAKPETIAAGLVYYCLKVGLGDQFQEAIYFEKSKVSRDTIISVADEIRKIVG